MPEDDFCKGTERLKTPPSVTYLTLTDLKGYQGPLPVTEHVGPTLQILQTNTDNGEELDVMWSSLEREFFMDYYSGPYHRVRS